MITPPPASLVPRYPALPADSTRRLAAGFALLLAIASSAARGEDQDGPAYPVSHFLLQLDAADSDDLPLDAILPLRVTLGRRESGWVAPSGDAPSETLLLPTAAESEAAPYHASAIASINSQLLAALQAHGFLGVQVAPHEADIALASERDLRRPGDTVLRLVVSFGRIRELRSVGVGDRLPPDWRIDNPAHRRIRERSPFQPAELERERSTDLLKRDELDAYLFRLNRHPGRRVDAALAPSEDGKGVALDYRVSEARPWFVYGQVTDSGTEQTNPWQQRYGFVHQQLSNRDDILRFEYMNSGFDDVNGFGVSYEAPWFGPERPEWMRGDSETSGWLSPARLPWIGSDRMRWRVKGGWSRFLADDVGFTDDFRNKEWNLGGQLIVNAWQRRALFLDLSAGLHLRDVQVSNRTLGTDREELLFYPQLGLKIERINQYSTLLADVALEYYITTLSKQQGTAQFLGRLDPDEEWPLLHADIGISHYLEPLLNRSAWEDPSSPSSSTLAHEIALGVRGQYSFDYRLIPQASQVVGGLFSVRGYPQSAAVGDSVVVGTLEYRFHLPRSLPVRREPLRVPLLGDFRAVPQQVYGRADWDLIFRAFADAGATFRHDRPANSPEQNQTLVGVGLGVEVQLGGNFRARVDWGRALHSTRGSTDDVKRGHNEFHFLLSVLF